MDNGGSTMSIDFNKLIDALDVIALKTNSRYTLRNNVIEGWTNGDEPTESEIDAEIIKQEKAYSDNEYARKRQAEYPTIAELTIALYDASDKEALVAKRNAVKLKYPKP